MGTEIQTGKLPVTVTSQKSPQTTEQRVNNTDSGAAHTTLNDTVSMTEQVSQLKNIEKQIAAIPSVDSAKVSEIKQAIADGSFEINPESIAEKLITMESKVHNN